MIGELLNIIVNELNTYLDKHISHKTGKKSVVLNKPNNLKGELEIPDNTISLSLLNIEQELSARDSMVKKQVIDGKVYKQEPAVGINLQLIFISNFPNDYTSELNYITKVMEFFQQKPQFNTSNTVGLNELKVPQLTFKLNTVELDEQHNVWSMLGGTYLPSVIYKVGLITIQEDAKLADDKIVKEVAIKVKKK